MKVKDVVTTINEDLIFDQGNNNKIIGAYPKMCNSELIFKGCDNLLVCGDNVNLVDSKIIFYGDNSLVYLSSNRYDYKITVGIYNNSVFHMGENNYINKNLTAILSEEKHFFVGDNGLFSFDICARVGDAHLIYDVASKERLNITKSVYIGDHVWIGQNSIILKGSQIDSGSIVGAMSNVTGKKIPHNSIWAGNPCKEIHRDKFWDSACVHGWQKDKTEKSMQYDDYISTYRPDCHADYWIYEYNKFECVEWDELERAFSKGTSIEKFKYLVELNSNKSKNRFVHRIESV